MARKLIDLDAARREANDPEGIAIMYREVEYELPPELPLATLDSFITEDFDAITLVRHVLTAQKPKGDGENPTTLEVIETVFAFHPMLHVDLLASIHAAMGEVFGPDQYETFRAARPSIEDYARILSGLFDIYGVSLGEAFASPTKSEPSGATPKPNAALPTASTSETPSEDATTPA